ncbi:hypothetical protein [Rhizobium bangladeshense]|nr:hypothetical protein [Rhizobium bangladeshense]
MLTILILMMNGRGIGDAGRHHPPYLLRTGKASDRSTFSEDRKLTL